MILQNSLVYFAECRTIDGADMGVVKVGISNDPERRVKSLTNNEPFVCSVICSTPGDMFLEYFCHMWLKNDGIGGEYFRRSAEVERLITSVKEIGELPFPIRFVSHEGFFSELDVVEYMEKKSISFADIERETGVNTQHYKKLLERERSGNRRFLAALAVTAVKKGHTIRWARDFKPSKADRRAAA